MAKLLLLLAFVLNSAFALPLSNETNGADLRIVGGSSARDGQYPYQVSIKTPKLPQNEHFCAGSIISADWILTAAHCVYRKPASSMIIVVGSNELNAGGNSYAIAEVLWHHGYLQEILLNDIAVLRVLGSITFNSNVAPVSLADLVTPGGVTCTFSGWGVIKYPLSVLTNNLQQISVTSVSVPECQLHLVDETLYSTNICTLGNGKGACVGDDGGPLVCNGKQHGILSWITPCAKGKPDVYSSVSAYRQWISDVTGV